MASIEPKQANSGKSKLKRAITVDMTAMVDVAFLLLTFFILTTTLSNPTMMETAIPVDDKKDIACTKNLTFYLGADDKVYWYAGCEMEEMATTDYSMKGIRKIVQEQLQTRDDLIIGIKPGELSNFENLVDIFDELKITGAPKYALSEMSEEEVQFLADRGMK